MTCHPFEDVLGAAVGNIPSFACSRLASANIFWNILAAYFARILSPVHNGGNPIAYHKTQLSEHLNGSTEKAELSQKTNLISTNVASD
jgi:hypothetical protein